MYIKLNQDHYYPGDIVKGTINIRIFIDHIYAKNMELILKAREKAQFNPDGDDCGDVICRKLKLFDYRKECYAFIGSESDEQPHLTKGDYSLDFEFKL